MNSRAAHATAVREETQCEVVATLRHQARVMRWQARQVDAAADMVAKYGLAAITVAADSKTPRAVNAGC